MIEICPLCKSQNSKLFYKNKHREFQRCGVCELIFVPKKYHLSPKEERNQYNHHQNSLLNHPYIAFLNQLLLPTLQFIKPQSLGLDFGSGPSPVLAQLYRQRDFNIEIYDIFYADNKSVFDKKYDVITSTEVFEHLANPLKEVKKLWKCLKVGGILAIMTGQHHLIESFESWYYIRDFTHISFFCDKSFEYIAKTLGAKKVFQKENVIILQKIR